MSGVRTADERVLAVEVGLRLQEAREAKGLSGRELAEACGLTPSTLSRFEHGKAVVGVGKLAKVATYLQVSADWLLTGTGPTATAPEPKPRVAFCPSCGCDLRAIKITKVSP